MARDGWHLHPEREVIANRYLRHQKSLTRRALEQLMAEEVPEVDEVETEHNAEEVQLEKPISLNEQRIGSAIAAIKASGAHRVLDLGCGEGNLLRVLMKEKSFTQIVGVDASHRALEIASRRLRVERMPEKQRARLSLLHGSLTYRDERLSGFEAAAALEVVEHLDPSRLNAFERCLFEFARPLTAVMTTPNIEYNVKFEDLPAGKLRHRDHRFEWTRAQFQAWAHSVSERFGYQVRFLSVRAGRRGSRITNSDGGVHSTGVKITIPELSLVVLIGPSGAGKSTFARRCFKPTEIISSDYCRGLVSDDENDQAATTDAFEVLHFIASKRLAAGKLTVVDATNVQPEARKPLVALAREYHCLPVAIVFNIAERVCRERNQSRPDRDFGGHVIGQQIQQMRRSFRGLDREGFRHISVLRSTGEIDEATIERQPLWCDHREETGPFDVIGDVHGCRSELEALLAKLGYDVHARRHPDGRKLVFLGDLVDRGPDTPGVLRIVMSMVESGQALCVPGNHDVKLMRKLRGRDVQITHGLAESLAQLESEPPEFKAKVAEFIDDLVSHYVLDGGKLVVAHAGMKAAMQGRGSAKVRDFALFGETTGETDEFGLPIRYDWASEYRGSAMVVYGHTPVPEPEWLNGTINIDTGCVFGGQLTALRYPERELVSVPSEKIWCRAGEAISISRTRNYGTQCAAESRRHTRRGRRSRQADHFDAASSQCHHPRRERGGRSRGHEPLCG